MIKKKKELTDFYTGEHTNKTMTMVWTLPKTGRQHTVYTNASVDIVWTREKGKRNCWMKAVCEETVQYIRKVAVHLKNVLEVMSTNHIE
jgi:hypothetical protein